MVLSVAASIFAQDAGSGPVCSFPAAPGHSCAVQTKATRPYERAWTCLNGLLSVATSFERWARRVSNTRLAAAGSDCIISKAILAEFFKNPASLRLKLNPQRSAAGKSPSRISETSMTILITGATGKIAQHLIPALLDQGQLVRAMVHSPPKAATLAKRGAGTVIASFEDTTSLDKAFAGVETLLFVTPPHERASAWASAGLAAAKQAGVKRIVRISALLAGADGPSDNNRQHGRTDDELRASGIPSVILRPHFFMQNLLADVPTLRAQNILYAAAGNARLSMIDTRDIADVAKCALLSSVWDGNTYDLTGPTSISFHEIAGELSEQLGREIRYVPVSPEALAQSIRDLGLDEWFAQGYHDYLLAYSRGWGDFTTNAVQAISGKQARTFGQFAKEILVPELAKNIQAA